MPKRSHRGYGRFFGPFGFEFFGRGPHLWFGGRPFLTIEEELEMLEDYKEYLEEELAEVNRRIERLKKEK